MVPLTDAYALRGVKRYGLNYGPLRLWGSAAFVRRRAGLRGAVRSSSPPRNLIWIIAGSAALGALASLGLQPLDDTRAARRGHRGGRRAAARRRLSRHHRGLGADPGQPCRLLHLRLDRLAAGRVRRADDRGPVGRWACLPRSWCSRCRRDLRLQPSMLVMIAALSAVARWVITAQEPPLAILAVGPARAWR